MLKIQRKQVNKFIWIEEHWTEHLTKSYEKGEKDIDRPRNNYQK